MLKSWLIGHSWNVAQLVTLRAISKLPLVKNWLQASDMPERRATKVTDAKVQAVMQASWERHGKTYIAYRAYMAVIFISWTAEIFFDLSPKISDRHIY